MISPTIIITIFSFVGSVTATKYHNCGCRINGVYDVELSHATCSNWAQSGEPNTFWDGYSCVDKKSHRGIDGNPWEAHCKSQYEIGNGGNAAQVTGWCWHKG